MSEGLKPVSRGRSGILRNFLKEAIFYSKKLDIDKENLINYIQRVRHERIGELVFLKTYERYLINEDSFNENLIYWINKMYQTGL